MIGLTEMKKTVASGRKTQTPEDRAQAYVDAVPGCLKGERSNDAYKLIAKLKDFGVESNSAVDLMRGWNSRNSPPLDDKELRKIVDNTFKYGKNAPGCDKQTTLIPSAQKTGEWDSIIPLEDISLPKFPLDIPTELASWKELVTTISHSVQVPAGLAGMFSLPCISTALSGRVKVETNDKYYEPCNLYTIVLSEPGTRKSSVKKILVAPILDYQKDLCEILRPEIESNRSEYRQLEQRRKSIEKELSKLEVDNPDALRSELDRLNEEIAYFQKPTALPQLISGDTTMEALAANMQSNNGSVAILDDEGGGFFGTISGRYKKGEQLVNDLVLKGYDGQPYYENRIGRDNISMDRTAINIGIAMQPAVLRELKHRKYLEETGMLPRFLFAMPPDTVGNRNRSTVSVPKEMLTDYSQRLKMLFTCRSFTEDLVIKMSEEADWMYGNFFDNIEGRMRQGQDLYPLRAWASKLLGKVARIAGVLNCYANADKIKLDTPQVISGSIMDYSVSVGYYLIEHAKAVYALVELSTDVHRAKQILRIVRSNNKSVIGQQDIWQIVKNSKAGIQKVADIEPAIIILIEHNYIRPIEPEQGKSGRPSIKFEVNPEILHS